jgi:hypothetical protein
MTGQNEKARRMELRRETGTRLPPREFKPTYDRAPTYRVAHACFACRRSFKIAYDPASSSQPEHRCPGCGEGLHWMGRTFTTPSKSDVEQWTKVERLWNAGFRFQSYRSSPDAEPLPDRLSEVDDFLRRNPKHPFRVRT